MPAVDSDDTRRGGRLLPVLFWSGVGIAPLAGLLLLLGNGDTPLRVAAALAVLAVVLIGLSVALRPDAEAVRLEMEETLLDEIDMLREDVREDIATAARATHQGFGERLQALQQTVDTMRNELQAVRNGAVPAAAVGRPGYVEQPAPPPVAPQRVPNGAPPAVAHAAVTPPASAPPGPVYGAAAGPDLGRAAPPRSAPPERGRAHVSTVPGGVFQHTETVQVTTRSSTYVDRHSENGDRGRARNGFGRGDTDHGGGRRNGANGRRGEPDRVDDRRSLSAPPVPRNRPAEPERESWTDQKLRERYGGQADRSDFTDGGGEPWDAREPERPRRRGRSERQGLDSTRGGRRRARDSEPEWQEQRGEEFEPYPGVRTGDRWAEVRSDDRGRELRLGERRASVHADDAGTELRIEDRWAAVRREEAARPDYGRRALPAAAEEPSWNESWEEPVRERERDPRARRRRGGDLDDFSYPATGSQRRIDYELSDERWR